VTYRLISDHRIKSEVATTLFQTFADRWRKEKQRTRGASKGGPSYYGGF
jgi:hypothetical protein